MGRKGYQEYLLAPETLANIEALARRGCLDEEIMGYLNINHTTFYDYVNKYSAFSDALKNGRFSCLIAVENALFKRAVGYRTTEITRELDKKTGLMVDVKEREIDVPADLGAQIFILKNRIPKSWKDKIISQEDQEAINKVEKMLVNIKQVANDASSKQ